MASSGGELENEIYIRNALLTYIKHRYGQGGLINDKHPPFKVSVRHDMRSWCYTILVHWPAIGWTLTQQVEELPGMLDVKNKHDWMEYQLQTLHEIADIGVFMQWFVYLFHPAERKNVQKVRPCIKGVHFTPKETVRSWTNQINDDTLVKVVFENNQVRYETINEIKKDPGRFLAMMLMVA
jgi:hypothetical protein